MGRPLVGATLVALLGAAAPAAPGQQLLEDTQLGIRLKAPPDFDRVPLKPDEEWIVARWISKRAYYQNDKAGFSFDYKPELMVVAFPASQIKDKVDVQKSGTGEQSKTIYILKNPYKDYRDYLKRTFNEGGYYVSKEDKEKVEDVEVETLEIKVEKNTFGGPRRIVTWIFKLEDADVAVQIEVLENSFDKLKGVIRSCMRTFRRIDKADDAGKKQGPAGDAVEDLFERKEDLSPAQRAAWRRQREDASQKRFVSMLTQGWSAKKRGRVFVMTDVDDRYTAKIAENANAVLDYLDSNLGYLGPAEYVRAPILRICKDSDEMRAYDKGSGFWFADRELVTYKDTNGFSWGWGDSVQRGVLEHWFRERDYDVYAEMPRWLEEGLLSCFGMSKCKGGKLDFFNDSWERVGLSQQVHSGKLSKAEDLIKMDSEELWSDRHRSDECAALVRYLLTGPKKARDALQAYLLAVDAVARKDAEESKKATPEVKSKPKTIEEEDAQFKAANTKQRDNAKKHLDDVFQAAFGGWSEADWKSFQSAYEKSIG